MAFDETSNSPEDFEASIKGIGNVPLEDSPLKVLRQHADDAGFHFHDNVHLAQRHVLEALGSVPVQRDSFLFEYLAGFGRDPSQRVRACAPGPNRVMAEMVGERLGNLAAAGVAEANKQNVDRAIGGSGHWPPDSKLEIGNWKLETGN